MTRVAYVVAGGDQELADDAVQAAWCVAWRKLGSLHDPARLKPWLVSVAANEARQLGRRQRRRAIVEIDVTTVDPAAADPADLAGALLSDGGVEGQGFPDKLAALLREVYPELPQVTVEYRNLCVVRMQAHELTA